MKIRIDEDEWYPVYSLDDSWGDEIDLPEDKIEWIRKVHAEFEETQKYLRAQYMLENIHPKHCCGLQGFNPILGDTCPACQEREKDENKES